MRKLPTWLTHWYTYRGAVGIVGGFAFALFCFGLYAAGVPGGVHPEDRLFPQDATPAQDVVIVGIDDKTIAATGHFPFTRDKYTTLLNNLTGAGAAAVVFDIGFSEPFTPDGDQKLHDAIAAAAKANVPVVLAYGQGDLAPGDHKVIQARLNDDGSLSPIQDEIPIRAFRCADAAADPYAPCVQQIADVASTAIVLDEDGVVRRMPMFVEPACHQQGKPCAATINPIGFTGYRYYFAPDLQLTLGDQGATFGTGWPQPLWVDRNGRAIVNFLGEPGTFERHGQYVSMSDVASGSFDASKVKGKVAIVGVYHATGIHDEKLVPTRNGSALMQGVELHANLVSQFERALKGSFLQPEPWWLVLLTLLVLGVGMGWVVARLSVLLGAASVVALLGAYTLLWVAAFEPLQMVPDLFHVWLGVALSYAGVTAYRFLYEDREKRKVTAIFGQYLKPELVKQLASVRTLDELTFGGERKQLTMLFVDIRGFTSMSETLPAEDVVAVATEYLTDLTRVIFKWDGTVDKYVGDEIVAAWNAVHPQENHALLAIRCAYDMITRAPDLQAHLVAHNLPPIRYGIGVNTGPAVWGSMGSPMRRQFTALGDTVNTAARFCGAAGAFALLIGEETYQATKDFIAVELAPGIQLKGKTAETFRIYKVVAIRETTSAPWVAFPTEMATQVTYQHTQQYRTQQTMLAAGATVSADAVTHDTPPVAPPAN
ncbi:MAG: adenylate/guanylate cyclase domain-containing protein [Chloroflexota bacterium]